MRKVKVGKERWREKGKGLGSKEAVWIVYLARFFEVFCPKAEAESVGGFLVFFGVCVSLVPPLVPDVTVPSSVVTDDCEVVFL